MTTHSADTAHTYASRSAYSRRSLPTQASDGNRAPSVSSNCDFGYVRVSTDMQAKYGLSLEAQQSQIAAYAKAYRYEMVGFYFDHDSAKNTTGRPEYLKMIVEVDRGKAGFIISTALDRFSRSQRDFLAFQDEFVKTDKVHLVLINQGINTELPASRQFLPLIVAFAQVYDLLRKERIHVIRSERGNKVFDRERAYNLAYALKADDRSYQFIADRLNKEGLRPGKASEYRWWSVQDLLRSAVYHDRSTAIGCAKYWKAHGKSLREIAMKLMEDGHRPKRGG